jgi:predicted ATPase
MQMTSSQRTELAMEFLRRVVVHVAQKRRMVLIAENVQKIGNPTLLNLLTQDITPILAQQGSLVVMTCRAVTVTLSECFDACTPKFVRYVLGALSRSDTNMLLCDLLGVVSVDPSLPEKVHEKARGNPHHTVQIVSYLQQARCIVVEGNECRVVDAQRLGELEVTTSMQNVMLARLEQITVRQQFVVKVASIAGHLFRRSMLVQLLVKAEAEGIDELDNDIVTLCRVSIFAPVAQSYPIGSELGSSSAAADASSVFCFAQPIMRQLVYKTLSSTIRTQLHIVSASWLIENHQGDLERYLGTIADHFLRAKNGKESIRFLDLAATNSFMQAAWQDTISTLHLLVYIADDTAVVSKQVQWNLMLAQSYIAIAEFNGALRHLQAVCDVGATLVGPSGMIDLEATEHSELYITRTCSWWKQSAFDKFPEWYVNELVEVRRPVIADVIDGRSSRL